MWQVVYIAPDDYMADKIKYKLGQEGFMVQLRHLSKSERSGQVEILVPSSEAQDVAEIISKLD
ncbi:glutamate decarboxylase [Proteinivorax hydrogeniformans]|uniref:Glutamate decarboxylase n=1 Tax=Proteinivorax hydrogeniformans TaxID=1826727 RepID=A0AAU8HVY1_9FIRM